MKPAKISCYLVVIHLVSQSYGVWSAAAVAAVIIASVQYPLLKQTAHCTLQSILHVWWMELNVLLDVQVGDG